MNLSIDLQEHLLSQISRILAPNHPHHQPKRLFRVTLIQKALRIAITKLTGLDQGPVRLVIGFSSILRCVPWLYGFHVSCQLSRSYHRTLVDAWACCLNEAM